MRKATKSGGGVLGRGGNASTGRKDKSGIGVSGAVMGRGGAANAERGKLKGGTGGLSKGGGRGIN